MQNKYICIHGHFYQPPRENAWLGAIELQDSALPFHDWNERTRIILRVFAIYQNYVGLGNIKY